jgi:hypothetical protein
MSRRQFVVIGSYYSRKPNIVIPLYSRVFKNLKFLRQLHTLAQQVHQGSRPEQDLHDYLQQASTSQIKALSEVYQNLMNQASSQHLIQKLNPFKTLIRRLASPKINSTQRRQLLLCHTHQRGGFAFLLPLLTPIGVSNDPQSEESLNHDPSHRPP